MYVCVYICIKVKRTVQILLLLLLLLLVQTSEYVMYQTGERDREREI